MSHLKLILVGIFVNMISTSVAISEGVIESIENYKNHRLEFELEHSNSWRVSEEDNSVSLQKLVKEDNQVISISFFVQRGINPNNYSIKEWYQEMENQLLAKGIKIPEMNVSYTFIGGVAAVLRERTDSLGKSFTYFVARKNSDIFSISYHFNKVADAEIGKIISTVKLND